MVPNFKIVILHLCFQKIHCLLKNSTELCPIRCLNASNCDKPICRRCEFSCGRNNPINLPNTCSDDLSLPACSSTCRSSRYFCRLPQCSGCFFCPIQTSTTCTIAYFEDITQQKFVTFSDYFYQWKHSGKPYPHEGSPLFVDINNDGILDYFNSMHAHNIDQNGYNRMELALTANVNATAAYGNISISTGSLLVVSNRIINTESTINNLDPHGEVMVDLDNDGYLDLLILSGGGEGGEFPNEYYASTRDNFLFWGEPSNSTNYTFFGDSTSSNNSIAYKDVDGGPITIFVGGRNMARIAGIEGRYGRTRIGYLLDVNNDGLLDIFCMQDRRVTNLLAPGILLINQGNRTWREEASMTEFSRAMILTDADGDGLANEFMINRGFCFPQRSGPGVDPRLQTMGPYSQEVMDFCSIRPVGTTAVYRYNNLSQRMDLISPSYYNVSANAGKQPACCPNGAWAGSQDCHARSIATGDFDGDLKTDHVFLYSSKLVFYFSSERPVGTLAGIYQYVGLEIVFPPNCIEGQSVRVLDLDNDGKEEILVLCRYAGGVLLYSRGPSHKNWTLNNGCNSANAMGSLVNTSLYQFSPQEIEEFCNIDPSTWNKVALLCKQKLPVPRFQLEAAGLSIIDLDNDGFLDIVATSNVGRIRFFKNTPSQQALLNRFIAFRLRGNGKSSNIYGIGATVILHTSEGQQFREIASYQHTTDKFGTKEDRIIFGLGKTAFPIKVVIRWPCGKETVSTFNNWTPSEILEPINLDENTVSVMGANQPVRHYLRK